MDFHTLSRKQLQTLCKKNKIPANITNVAMATALSALNHVEGLDEFLNENENGAGTPDIHYSTAARASAQRKAVREETEGPKVKVTTWSAGAGNAEDQENKDGNVAVTPAVVAVSRRRTTAVSTRRKKEAEKLVDDNDDDDKKGVQGKQSDVAKTPAAAPKSRTRGTGPSVCTKMEKENPSGASLNRPYNTRRSVRLLENSLSKMSLMDAVDTGLDKIDDVSEELSNVSQQVEKVASVQTASTVWDLEDSLELEVSQEKNAEYECLSHDLGSDEKLVSVTENDTCAGLQAELQEDVESEPPRVNYFEAELHDSNLEHDSNEAGSELSPVLEESCDSTELVMKNEECLADRQDALPVQVSEDACKEVTDQDITASTILITDDVSVEVIAQDVAGLLPVLSVSDASLSLTKLVECNIDDQGCNEGGDDKIDKNIEPQEEVEPHDSILKVEGGSVTCVDSDEAGNVVSPLLEETCDSYELEIENKEFVGARQNTLPIEVPDQDIAALDCCAFMNVADQDAALVSLNEFVECNIDGEGSNEGAVIQDKNNETDHFEPVHYVDEKVVDGKDFTSPEVAAICEKSGAIIGLCTESSPDGKECMEVKNVTLESSLLDMEAEEDPKNISSVIDGICSPQIPLVNQQVSVESVGSHIDGALNCNSNTVVDGVVVSEDIVIPKQEPCVSETMTIALIHSNASDQVKENVHNADVLKENMTTDELYNMSMGELKRMLKQLTLDDKSNCKTNNVAKEVKKRTALQALPQNRMTTSEAQNDG